MDSINLISVAIAGITTGGLTCFAVQGGLLTSAIANARKAKESEPNSKHSDILPVTSFIIAKLLAYTLIGALLGGFGSLFNFNATTQAAIQILIGLYMLGVAANLLNIHPFFRYFIIQPPHFIQRFIRKTVKNGDEIVTPAILGLLTLLIPCGTTLAMEALAVSSGSPVMGAAIMATFVASSSWVFIGLGLISSRLTDRFQSYFYRITAGVLAVLAVLSVNSGLNLFGVPYTLDAFASAKSAKPVVAQQEAPPPVDFEAQKVAITIDSRGYTASTRFLRKDVPVELTLETKNSYSCANAFAIPSLNIMKLMPENGMEKITFIPKKAGRLVYSCSMGMFRGEFLVQ